MRRRLAPLRRALCAWGLVLVCQLVATAHAQPAVAPPAPRSSAAVAEPKPVWASLAQAQQEALRPLKGEWSTIDTARKQKWLEIAARVPSMSAEERERVQLRMTEWARLTPTERGRARLQFQETRQLSPLDRQTRWDAYKALTPAERDALAAKAAPMAATPSRPPQPEGRVPLDGTKRNVIAASTAPAQAKPVAPSVIQAKPGATTTLVSKSPSPPAHHQPGLPKIAATKGFVDPATLLPKRGPQGAAVAAAPTAASGSSSPQ